MFLTTDKKQKRKEESDNRSILDIKEAFYAEEDISPEVKGVLDDIFANMVVEDTEVVETSTSIKSTIKDRTILDIKEEFYAEEDISPEVKGVLDEVFANMVVEDTKVWETPPTDKPTVVVSVGSEASEIESKPEELAVEKMDTSELEKELKSKIKYYEERALELQEKIIEYEERTKDFKQRSKNLEESREDFAKRVDKLEESRKEFEDRGIKLKEAREQFVELSKGVEEKKIDIEKRELRLNLSQKSLDKSRYELEKNRLDFEKSKLKFERGSVELGIESGELGIKDELIITEKVDVEKGKVDVLRDILEELLYEGGFQSCFLIDEKGMIISEYSQANLDAMAIGAMFSLVTTTILRTIKNLKLNELLYFKLSSLNGAFILKSITIKNYERSFILLAYYDETNLNIPSTTTTLKKKTINKILRNVKKDFKELRNGTLIFDILVDRIVFLKKKYETPEKDIELIRVNLLNKNSIKIMELFEM